MANKSAIQNSRTQKGKKISIMIISKNAKSTIRRCLDSVLAQTYPNTEIVVVDSSNDGTEKILEEYKKQSKFPFKLIYQEPRGCGAARNEGLKNASGDVITAIDSDDWIPRYYIEKIAKPFDENDNVIGVFVNGIITSSANTFFSDLVKLYEDITLYKDEIFYDKPHKYLIASKREVQESVGDYEEDAEVGEEAVRGVRVKKVLEELKAKGYVFATVNTYFISERQAHTFKEHWKKCMWYAKALANKNYIKSDFKNNVIKIFGSAYISVLPLLLILTLFYNTMVMVGLVLLPLLILVTYMTYRALSKRILTWKFFLLPIVVYYRAFFTFIGVICEVFSKSRRKVPIC